MSDNVLSPEHQKILRETLLVFKHVGCGCLIAAVLLIGILVGLLMKLMGEM